jgi:hypothetical protein
MSAWGRREGEHPVMSCPRGSASNEGLTLEPGSFVPFRTIRLHRISVIPSQILEKARALMRGRKRELAGLPAAQLSKSVERVQAGPAEPR